MKAVSIRKSVKGQAALVRTTSRRAAIRTAVLATPVVMAAVAMSPATRAASVYWDGDGTGIVGGGSGLWDTTLSRFSNSPVGTSYGPFAPGDDPFFGNSGGFVQVGTDALPSLTANSLNVTTGGYVFLSPSADPGSLALSTGTIDTGVNTVQILARLTGGAGLTKTGSGTLVFEGANTYTGATVISAGTLALGNTAIADIPNTSAVQIAAPGALKLNQNGGFYSDTVGSLDGAGSVVFGSPLSGYGSLAGSVLTAGGDNTTTSFSGVLSGAGGQFVKTGVGTLTLSGANTITGSITVNNGMLNLDGGSAVGDTTPLFVNPLFDSTNTLIGAGNVTLNANETVGGLAGGFATGTPQSVNLNGNTLTINSVRNLAYNAVITGNGNLVKNGANLQQFTNANSNFVGTVTLNQGIMIASRDLSLGNASNTVILDGGTLSNFPSTGIAYAATRSFTVGANGGGINVIESSLSTLTSTIPGNISGTGSNPLVKGGPGTLALTGSANAFVGGLTINEGIVSTTRTSGAPLGTGSIDVKTGFIVLNPSGAVGATLNLATDAGRTLTFGPGTQLQANRGSNPLFTLNIGGTAGGSLISGANGTLTILPSAYANLGALAGNREVILVTGGVPVYNGIVSPRIVSWQSTGGSAGDWLTYGANGFAPITYAGGDLNAAAGATVVYKAAAAQTLTANRQVYALHTAGQTITLSDATTAYNLTIGDGTADAGLIMNIGGNIAPGPTAGSQLIFNADEALIFTQNTAAGNINVPLSITGNKGLTKFGYGSVTLQKQATYAGPTTIGQGLLAIGIADALPTTTSVNIMGHPASTNTAAGVNYPSLKLTTFNQTIAELKGSNSVGRVDLGSAVLTVNQSTNSTYAGVITGINTGATQGQLVKSGIGTLTLGNQYVAPVAASGFPNLYGKLRISGGTVAVVSPNALPGPSGFNADGITIENGAKLQYNGVATNDSTLTPADALNQNAGVTLGSGGGVIEVTNPLEIVILQDIGVQSTDLLNPNFNRRNAIVHDITGPGDLTKSGPGLLRLYANAAALDPTGSFSQPIANTYTGKTIVTGGTLQFPDDGALGAVPGSYVADQLSVSNNAILQSNGAATIAANRGITIGPGGGQIYTTSSMTINSPLAGSGALTKTGGSSLSLNGASPSFSGGITLTNGATYFNATDSAGTGSINITPTFPVVVGKNSGVSNAVLNNPVNLGAGATIDFRVDGGAVGSLELAGPISGPGNLYVSGGGVANRPVANANDGAGTLILSNASNTFTGGVIVQRGKLQVTTNLTSPSAISVNGGTLELASGGGSNRVIKSPSISVVDTGKLDVRDNKLVTRSAIGTWTGSEYRGITGMIAAGRNGGVWDGPGITTSMPDATGGSGYTLLGVATGSEVKGIGASDTDTWGGQTITGSDTLVMYTYGGDANLSGSVDIDDYGQIDSNASLGGILTGWFNGDFDYNGVSDIDDYGIIDSIIGIQGAPFPTASGVGMTIAAVPEPAGALISLVGAAVVGSRRRRRAVV